VLLFSLYNCSQVSQRKLSCPVLHSPLRQFSVLSWCVCFLGLQVLLWTVLGLLYLSYMSSGESDRTRWWRATLSVGEGGGQRGENERARWRAYRGATSAGGSCRPCMRLRSTGSEVRGAPHSDPTVIPTLTLRVVLLETPL